MQAGQPRLRLLQLVADEEAHDLDGQRGDVEIGAFLKGVAAGDDADAADPSVLAVDRLDLVLGAVVDPERAQMREPGVDPDVARRAVEDAVGLATGSCEVEQQLEEDVAARAGAHLAGLGRYQRAGEPVGEELAVGR